MGGGEKTDRQKSATYGGNSSRLLFSKAKLLFSMGDKRWWLLGKGSALQVHIPFFAVDRGNARSKGSGRHREDFGTF